MDDHRPTDALTDSAIEREIETMLAVEPSPDFLARVRARVADEPAPGTWRFEWQFAAAAAAIIATAAVWQSLEPARSIEGSADAPLVAEGAAPPIVSSPTERVAPPVRPIEPVRRGPEVRPTRQATAEPEMRDPVAVIAPEDRKGFELLLSSIRQPEVVLVLNEDTTGPPALAASNIEIAPIDIAPVPPVAQLEGGVE